MRTTTISAILVLALAQMASAAQTLTVNGEALDEITLKTGQACTVEIVYDNSNPYSAYVGFDDGIVLGSFSHQQTMPEAGDLGAATEYSVPAFYGYFVTAAGSSPSPSAGVHFVFTYNPSTVGVTMLKLYDATLTVLLDSVEITVLESAIGTSITYQGRLMENSDVANGLYDIRFELYDSPSNGSLIGSAVEANDLDVVDGYFTIELDFENPEAFNGEGRWLKIGVRVWNSSDPNGYTVLSPRQRIAATPQALGLRGVYVDSDENIGMGTTSPTGKLHVDGGKAEDDVDGSNISIKAQGGGDRPSGGIGITGCPGGDIILMPGDGGLGPLGMPGPSGYVGIGTSSPLHDLHIYDSAGHTYVNAESEGGYAFFLADGNYNSGLTIKENGTTKANVYWNTANDSLSLNEGGVDRLVVKGGNVGIGVDAEAGRKVNVFTDSQLYGLHVENTKAATGISTAIMGLANSGEESGAYIGVAGHAVGPGDNYGVYGKAITPSSNSNVAIYGFAQNSGTGNALAGFLDGDVYVSGKMGIGYPVPASRLEVRDGCITGSMCSDIRLKKNIEPLPLDSSILDRVMGLQAVTFEWKHRDDGKRQIGLIAQDVEDVFPGVVTTPDDDSCEKGLLTIGLDAVLVEAIKELKVENERLKDRIEALEKRMDQRQFAVLKEVQ